MNVVREFLELAWPAKIAGVIILLPSLFTLGVFFFYVAKHVRKGGN